MSPRAYRAATLAGPAGQRRTGESFMLYVLLRTRLVARTGLVGTTLADGAAENLAN